MHLLPFGLLNNLPTKVAYGFILLATLFVCLPVSANSYLASLHQDANQRELYQHPYWLALGHYKVTNKNSSTYESYSDDPKFFLSVDGKRSPQHELEKTLDAFFADYKLGDAHAQCRFVARFNWLTEQLSIDKTQLPVVDCALYNQWFKTINASSISLIFASHYVYSPSSMYGHTLLRIDPPQKDKASDWLSYAVNFGATVNEDDQTLLYAWRGLTGGYSGIFAMGPYYEKIQTYSNMENRGLWEYKLGFNADEVDLLVTHLWELRDIHFDYYFFDENCSYRLLELLEIARPELDLLSSFSYKAIPTDTARAVKNSGLIANTNYRPSKVEELQYRSSKLSESQKRLAVELSQDASLLSAEPYISTDKESKKEILDVAYNYSRYQQRQVTRNVAMAETSHRLLLEVNAVGRPNESIIPRPVDPIEGHETTMLAVSAGEEDGDAYVEAQWRASYHDLLDEGSGYAVGLGIQMFGITARQWEGGRSTLERLDVVDISSLAARDEFVKPWSWRAKAGMERIYNDNGSELATQATGGAGLSYELAKSVVGYALVTGRAEYNEDFKQNSQIGAGVALGVTGALGSVNASIELNGYEMANGIDRSSISAALNYALSTNHALRLKLETVDEDSYSDDNFNISYRYYY